jgi:small conductance mechanosensitive channel
MENNLNVDVSPYVEKAVNLVMGYMPRLALALITLVVGLFVIRMVVGGFHKGMQIRHVDETLQDFILKMLGFIFKALLLISVASMVGIATSSFVAVLGAAGLAVGLALQGSLSNFAGGILILFFRPFVVGDVIEANGFLGCVHKIQIFNTILLTLDNQKIIMPNSILSNGTVTNLFAEETRRVDMKFGISYNDDVRAAKDIFTELLASDDRVLKSPEPEVYLAEHGDSSVNFIVRGWVKSDDYWPVYFDMHERVKLTLDEKGISIPFPQRDVHLIQE